MGRSKLKRRRKIEITDDEEKSDESLIKNLPKSVLTMKVNSGTKIRNVLNYAIKEFGKYECILWTAAGGGVGKAISCAEIFKREHKNLHQITKLQHIDSKRPPEDGKRPRQVPEIHICLTKVPLNHSEPGYQSPDDQGMFQNSSSDSQQGQGSKNRISSSTAEEFAKMGLRTAPKRPRGNSQQKTQIKRPKGTQPA